jgi:hypothetical protein
MTEHLISMFIDDELNLDEKIEFVETVHGDLAYKTETVDLLVQEKRLRTAPVRSIPTIAFKPAPSRRRAAWLRPLMLGLGSAAALVILWVAMAPHSDRAVQQLSKSHRFIIYRPDISKVEISGSFTGWQPRTMNRIGDSGYWEVELALPGGEHRFSYILEGRRHIADPTVLIREKDDFGGENSILSVSL